MSEVKIMLGTSFTELENGQTYYARVYTVNPEGYMQSEIGTQIGSAIPQDFPAEPSEYVLIGTYTSAQTWTAPEDGWFKIELFGASGSGGAAKYSQYDDYGTTVYEVTSGFGGGGGGYSLSEGVALNAGDIISCSTETNGTMTLNVYSSVADVASITMSCTRGGDGPTASTSSIGITYPHGATGGAGGVASGGTTSNINGGAGANRILKTQKYTNDDLTAASVSGGAAGHADGNAGGNSGACRHGSITAQPGSGKAAFFRVSRGNTNVVA